MLVRDEIWFWIGPTKRRAQLRELILTHGAGRFRRGLAHIKTEISNFLVLVVIFLLGWFLVFCFLSENRKQKKIEISNRTKK